MRKGIKIGVQRLLLCTVLLSLMSLSWLSIAYAEDDLYGLPTQGGGSIDNGQGSGSGGSNYYDELGIQQDNSGYRVYLETKGGQVVDGYAVDLYFKNEPPQEDAVSLNEYTQTTIGGATVSAEVQYNEAMQELLPGLVPPIAGHLAQGNDLNYWFEQKNSNYPESTNAEIFLSAVYKLSGKSTATISDYIEKFHLGEYRLVVEAIYWFGYVRNYEYLPVEKQVTQVVEKEIEKEVPDPNDPDKMIIVKEKVQETQTKTEYHKEWVRLPYVNPLTGETHQVRHYIAPDQSKVTWVYGTIRETAAFEQSKIGDEDFRKGTGMDKVSPTCQYGTEQFYGHTNQLMATTLYLKETDGDGFSGMGTIGSPSYNGLYSYSQIKNKSEGFATHIIRKEQASEQWATWDASAYGGPVGKSPGVTPKMPPLAGMENVTTTWRDVTVIKYYEEYSTDKETGKARSS